MGGRRSNRIKPQRAAGAAAAYWSGKKTDQERSVCALVFIRTGESVRVTWGFAISISWKFNTPGTLRAIRQDKEDPLSGKMTYHIAHRYKREWRSICMHGELLFPPKLPLISQVSQQRSNNSCFILLRAKWRRWWYGSLSANVKSPTRSRWWSLCVATERRA